MMYRLAAVMMITVFLWPTAQVSGVDVFDSCAAKKNVVEHESPLPHGTQHMRVQGKCTVVVEPAGIGESTLDTPKDLELEGHYPMLPALFPKVIRDKKRDLFGPWQGWNGKKDIRFVFLRYHRLSADPKGPHAVQAGEAVVPRRPTKGATIRIAWEPPHRTERFPWCYLLSWDPGKKLLYRCLEGPTEPGGNMQRETKREFHVTLDTEDTLDYTFYRECPTAAPDDACSAWEETPRSLLTSLPCMNRRPTHCADAATKPAGVQKLCKERQQMKEVQEVTDACEREVAGQSRVAFIIENLATNKPSTLFIGETGPGAWDYTNGFMRNKTEPFCEIRSWEPEVRLDYECENPGIATTAAYVAREHGQIDYNLKRHRVRRCTGSPPLTSEKCRRWAQALGFKKR